jgi:hypothetical protein
MKRFTVISLLGIVSGLLMFADTGAIQVSLGSTWRFGPLLAPMGMVVLNTTATRQKMPLTYILQNAAPNATYAVGFDIVCPVGGGSCPDIGAPFGAPQDSHSGIHEGVDLRIYLLGTVTTDVDGDGSVHFNLLNLPTGSYQITFWVSRAGDPLTPVAATSRFLSGPHVTVNVP